MPSATALPVAILPLLPSGSELFDAVMELIEPDLLSVNMETTKQKILAATPEERIALVKRYNAAFAQYDTQVVLALKQWAQEFHAHKRSMMHMLEGMASSDEQTDIDALVSEISTAS